MFCRCKTLIFYFFLKKVLTIKLYYDIIKNVDQIKCLQKQKKGCEDMNFRIVLSESDKNKVQKICHLLRDQIDIEDIKECNICYNMALGGAQHRKCGILLCVLYTISNMFSIDENVRKEANLCLEKILKKTKQGVI